MRRALRILSTGVALTLLLLVAGFVYEQIGRAYDSSRLPPRIGWAVDVGGRTVNLYCSGQGSPTVILETGGNAPGYEWAPMQSKIANLTRTCWYDRAGVGWSDPPREPRTSASVTTDLHRALNQAGETPPYVLVGASVGGEYARVFTGRYPNDVAGLVFVDSANPDQQEPPFQLSRFNRMSSGKRHLICVAFPFMTRFGILRFVANRMRRPEPDQTDQTKILAALKAQPKAIQTDVEQGCAATNEGRLVPTGGTGNPELDEAARKVRDLGNRPLIVLTAGKYWSPPGMEKEAAEFHEIWIHQLQASLARLSTRSQQVIVDSSHDMSGASDAIIQATLQVVNEVRTEKPN
jgi:pimeloyl-ACP methyl ester carboxylesterase